MGGDLHHCTGLNPTEPRAEVHLEIPDGQNEHLLLAGGVVGRPTGEVLPAPGQAHLLGLDAAQQFGQLLDQGLEQGAGRRYGQTKLRLSSKRSAMELVNIHQAKTHLSQLLQEVEQGQDVVIARSGVPIARLVAWQAPAQPVAAPGAMRGQIQLDDNFDAPLDGLFEALR